MDSIQQAPIKEEDVSEDLSFTGSYVPDNFDPIEWNNLINVIITACYHILG